MCTAQLAEPSRAERREVEPDDALIDGVGAPVDEARIHRAVDEPDRAVVAKQQGVGDIADRRRVAAWTAPDREEQLMLRGRDADRS